MSMILCAVIERQLISFVDYLLNCAFKKQYICSTGHHSQARLLNLKHSMILMADNGKLLS